jgi:hypothetical protein
MAVLELKKKKKKNPEFCFVFTLVFDLASWRYCYDWFMGASVFVFFDKFCLFVCIFLQI